ncbi:MAG: hypothetical protein ACOH2D_12070 [Gelidibacter sp.]|uniref:hypothetical protein n=1 Tax=Gelidibacter sp. TaxID=2018083 RepID=UPI0032664678
MKILLIVGVLGLCAFCSSKEGIHKVQKTKIRVINLSEEHFTNVMLFSMNFQDLKPRDTSEYQVLNFDPLKDDSLIYCSVGGVNFARYLEIPVNEVKNVSYLIDSIQNGILYITTKYED